MWRTRRTRTRGRGDSEEWGQGMGAWFAYLWASLGRGLWGNGERTPKVSAFQVEIAGDLQMAIGGLVCIFDIFCGQYH